MAQFNLNDYETVAERLPKFLSTYDNPRVITLLQSPVSDLSTVVFRSELYSGDTLLSTGWAFEREGAGYVNKTSHLENCETSAIGRALANIGIHGDKRPSREEMEKVSKGKQKQPAPEKEPLLSQHQQDEIKAKLKESGIPAKAFGVWLTRVVNVKKLALVPERWYQHIISVLGERPNEITTMANGQA